MENRPIRRRTLLASSVTAGLAGTAGCLSKQQPKATHWATGIRWSESIGEVFDEWGFSPRANVRSYSANPRTYFRVNDGDLQRTALKYDSVPAERDDRVEIVIDFDTWRQGEEAVFEYTIPDDEDLVGVLAGFAECLHYRDTDEWIVRPLNVDIGTDLLGRQKETLLVTVRRERGDENPDWFVWGHTESIRDDFRDLATRTDAEVDLEFVDPGEEATFGPASFHLLGTSVFDGADQVARLTHRDPSDDP